MRSQETIEKIPSLVITDKAAEGRFGLITIRGIRCTIAWTWNNGWEHVSISPLDHRATLGWNDMCTVKDMFFEDEEVVVQYHPKKSEYINIQKNCLHLWRPIEVEMPRPEAWMCL